MRVGTVDINQLRGIANKSAGLAKEFVGTLVGNDRLQEEGEAQQERASEELKAFRKQVQAEASEAKARVQEQRQRTAQRAKESA
jgi:uncharacterized protein YjbJ (UPF0337 family)